MLDKRPLSLVTAALLAGLMIAVGFGGVTAAQPAENETVFEVDITETNNPIEEGETLVVDATITNVGDAEDSQQIHLQDADNEFLDSIMNPPLTLEPDESETVTLEWETTTGDAGDHVLKVSSDFDSQNVAVEVTQAEEHESGVSQALFTAVNQDGEELTIGEIRNAVSEWQNGQEIDGVSLTISDLRLLVDWWQIQQL